MQKSSVTDYLFVSFFEVKNQNTYTQDFINAVNLLLANKIWEYGTEKKHICAFFKTNVTFPSYFALYS